jgi:hypothetical protein
MPGKQNNNANPRKVIEAKRHPRKKAHKGVSEKAPSRRDITLKALRAHDVNRAHRVIKMVPKLIAFYKKLEPMQIAALKYYKGPGSYFQSMLLANYSNTKKSEKRELPFPFRKFMDTMFYMDILGKEKMEAIYELELPSAVNFDKYIDQSYGKRVELLNHLDSVYDRPDCPKLTGDEVVFRGMSEVGTAITKLKPGDTYTFKNFISTTLDRKVSENFSEGDCVFVLSGLKDIPFLYMPGGKHRGDESYTTFLSNISLVWDLSEITLPRNLEFEVTSVERRNINSGWRMGETAQIGKLLKTLKNSGIKSEEEIIESALFPKGLFIFAKLKSWLPREPLSFDKIKKESKFVLDKGALNSWKGMEDDD